jgi:hypothetical protein
MSPKHKRRRRPARALSQLPLAIDDAVLTFEEWCQLNQISARTGHRILKGGDGPIITRLSAHRLGITVGNNRNWQRARSDRKHA